LNSLLFKLISLLSNNSLNVLTEHRKCVRDGVGEPNLIIVEFKSIAEAQGIVSPPPVIFGGHPTRTILNVESASLPTHKSRLIFPLRPEIDLHAVVVQRVRFTHVDDVKMIGSPLFGIRHFEVKPPEMSSGVRVSSKEEIIC